MRKREVAARYLSKYVGKAIADGRRVSGLHRYEVAQGFQPERLVLGGRTEGEVLDRASDEMVSAPVTVWRSSTVEGWRGPPACWASWA